MKKTWYFGVLMAALAFLVVMQQRTVVPNQEIVLEFADIKITSAEAQQAIILVKEQLKSVGIQNCKVTKGIKDQTLKITYYSDTEVACIKGLLSNDQSIGLHYIFDKQNNEHHPSLPVDTDSKNYSVNVYEIQKSTDTSFDYTLKYVLGISQERQGIPNLNIYSFDIGPSIDPKDMLAIIAQKSTHKIALAIDHDSYRIPEGRAGPVS